MHRGDPQARNTSRPAMLRLSNHLLANYKKGVRPVRDWRTPTTVSIDVIVYAILSVVSAWPHHPAQRWTFWVGDHVRPSHPRAAQWAFRCPQDLCSDITA